VNPCISAVQHLRPLRGGAQSHLLRASDGNWYVTKFQNNPQYVRVLANEMLATRLGLALGLPMPRVEVIEVSNWLIEHTEDLRIQLAGQRIPCRSGKQLGSLYVGSPGMTLDYLPQELLARVSNGEDFARVLVLDKWACNADGRQAVYVRKTPWSRRYSATFIDQGYCFNAGEWTFPDYPLRGVYATNCVYEGVAGWEAFEPALTRAEEMDADAIWRCAVDIPEEWYEGDRDGLNQLVEALHYRRGIIRKLITEFRTSTRSPFPNPRSRSTRHLSRANSKLPNISPALSTISTSNRGTRSSGGEPFGASRMRSPLRSRNLIRFHNSKLQPSWANSWKPGSHSRSKPAGSVGQEVPLPDT
jgi:hypothetical protein